MNNELQTQLASILAAIQRATSASADFALTQLPDIAQQYVMYGRVSSLWTTTALLAAAAAMLYVARWAYKNPWYEDKSYHADRKQRTEGNLAVIAIPAAMGTVLLLIAVTTFNWMVWIAPKVWLLRALARMVGGN